jgi:hypothetical protein
VAQNLGFSVVYNAGAVMQAYFELVTPLSVAVAMADSPAQQRFLRCAFTRGLGPCLYGNYKRADACCRRASTRHISIPEFKHISAWNLPAEGP